MTISVICSTWVIIYYGTIFVRDLVDVAYYPTGLLFLIFHCYTIILTLNHPWFFISLLGIYLFLYQILYFFFHFQLFLYYSVMKFFLRNFCFVFINKHNIKQVSLCDIITNCINESLFGNYLSAETLTIQKPGNWFGMQINWLVFIQYESTPKGISKQTMLTRTLPTHYRNIAI